MKGHKTKKLLIPASLILICIILAACGGNGEEASDTTLAHDASDCTTEYYENGNVIE